MRYDVLINELKRFWEEDFVAFRQSRANSSLLAVLHIYYEDMEMVSIFIPSESKLEPKCQTLDLGTL